MKSNKNVVSKNERKRSQDHKLFLTIYSKYFLIIDKNWSKYL